MEGIVVVVLVIIVNTSKIKPIWPPELPNVFCSVFPHMLPISSINIPNNKIKLFAIPIKFARVNIINCVPWMIDFKIPSKAFPWLKNKFYNFFSYRTRRFAMYFELPRFQPTAYQNGEVHFAQRPLLLERN